VGVARHEEYETQSRNVTNGGTRHIFLLRRGEKGFGDIACGDACSALRAVVLIEGVFTIDLAQAATDGHQATSITSFDVMTVFTHIYPIAPAPLIFLALGTILLGAQVLPRTFAYLALALGSVFEILGVVGLFTVPAITLIPLVLQAVWVVAAAIALLVQSGTAADLATVQPQEQLPV
jgi:hypothetical protein